MASRIFAYLYRSHHDAERVVSDLEAAGIPRDDISIIASKAEGSYDSDGSSTMTRRVDRDADGTDDRAEGAAAGAGIGATVGGVAGLLAGLGLMAIPGIGPVVAAGWLASTAAMAAAGGTAGGLIGALTQSGLGEDEAHVYAEGVRRGGTLVSVRVDDARAAEADAIMRRHNPVEADALGDEDRKKGWTGFQGSHTGDRIVAVFENAERAREARVALVEDGVDNARMEVLDNTDHEGNWSAMKAHSLPDEDSHLYAEGLHRGHAVLVIRADAGEHDRVMQVLGRFNPIDLDDHAAKWRQAGWSGVYQGKSAWEVRRQQAQTTTARTGTQEQVIPVYEEELKVGKRTVEQGHVRVRVYTVEKPVQEGLTLREERVAVERRPVDRPVSGTPGEAFRERTIDVTTHREEPVVGKEARVKEEIVVRKEDDQRTETVRDTVRRSEVEIEDDRAKATTPAPAPTPKPRR